MIKADRLYVYVSPHFHLYGAEKSLLAILREMKRRQKKTIVILPEKGEICEILDREKIEYIVLKFTYNVNYLDRQRWIYGTIKYLYNYFGALKVIKKIRGQKVAFVHTNSIVTDFGVQLANMLDCPHIQHIREFGMRDFHMTFELGKKFVQRIHKKDSAIICISNAIKKEYAAIFPEQQMKIIYNGVHKIDKNKNTVSLDNNYRIKPSKIVLIGRLSEEKGQMEAIKAIELLKQQGKKIQLDLYGDGDYKPKLLEYVRSNQLFDIVNFKGYCSDIVYSDYAIGLVCSKDEAFGRVTVEYMLHQLPVIGANTGATSELLDNGKVGILYRKGNAEDLAEKIQELLDNPNRCVTIKKAALKYAEKHFSEKRYVDDVMKLYTLVLKGDLL